MAGKFTSVIQLDVRDSPMRAQVGKFTLSADGLRAGFDVSEESYVDLQKEAAGALARD